MMTYFQAAEDVLAVANILKLTRDIDAEILDFRIFHNQSPADVISSNLIPTGGKIAALQATDIGAMDGNFSTWWAIMSTVEENFIDVTHNVWSGVGNNPFLFTGHALANNLTGDILLVGRAYIGPETTKFVSVQESVVVDRVLTTGQLAAWACGVPAPQAGLPGNIVFYQPLVSGYNESGSIGTVGFTGVGILETVVGPVMVDMSNNIDIVNGAVNLQVNYGQVDSDNSGILSNSDSGVLTYSLIYGEGTGLGNIDNIYHNSVDIASGEVQVLDLQIGTFDPINISLDRGMARVKSVTLENKSGTGNLYLDFSTTNSSTIFRDMFGDPSGLITLPSNSSYHINDGAGSGYIVDSNNSDLVISGGDFVGTGTLFITVMGDI